MAETAQVPQFACGGVEKMGRVFNAILHVDHGWQVWINTTWLPLAAVCGRVYQERRPRWIPMLTRPGKPRRQQQRGLLPIIAYSGITSSLQDIYMPYYVIHKNIVSGLQLLALCDPRCSILGILPFVRQSKGLLAAYQVDALLSMLHVSLLSVLKVQDKNMLLSPTDNLKVIIELFLLFFLLSYIL